MLVWTFSLHFLPLCMKVKIHYTIGDYQDYYILAGETVADTREQNEKEMKKRGLDPEKNDMFSEEL